MGASQSSRTGAQKQIPTQKEIPSLEEIRSLAELQKFFRDVRDGDIQSMHGAELEIWDFILFYIEWLESPTPFGPEELDAKYQNYRKKHKYYNGSMPREDRIRDFDRDLGKMRRRLAGNEAQKIHYSLLEAVAESFKSETMPPKFDYKQLRNPEKAAKYERRIVSETFKNTRASQNVTTMIPNWSASNVPELAEYHKKMEEMTAFFTKIQKDQRRAWDPLVKGILQYLEWLAAPYNNDTLQIIYQSFRSTTDDRYIRKKTRRKPLAIGFYHNLLALELGYLTKRVEMSGGEKCHMELVRTVFEFLKRGRLPMAAQRLATRIRPPPVYDANQLPNSIESEKGCAEKLVVEKPFSAVIKARLSDLKRGVLDLETQQQQQIVIGDAEKLKCLGAKMSNVKAQELVLTEAMEMLRALEQAGDV